MYDVGGWGWRLIQHQRLGRVGLCESPWVGLNHVIKRSLSDPTYSGGAENSERATGRPGCGVATRPPAPPHAWGSCTWRGWSWPPWWPASRPPAACSGGTPSGSRAPGDGTVGPWRRGWFGLDGGLRVCNDRGPFIFFCLFFVRK